MARHKLTSVVLFVVVFLSGISNAEETCSGKNNKNWPKARDPFLWPFSQISIWNMPIGCQAKYVYANLEAPDGLYADEDIIIKTTYSDPLVEVRRVGEPSYGKKTRRCSGKQSINGSSKYKKIHFPYNLLVPDIGENFAFAIVAPDGRSVYQGNALARCKKGGPIFGIHKNFFKDVEDLYGSGIMYPNAGGHGGTGLSSIGGTIRAADLEKGVPIRHVLKMNLRGWQYHFGSKKGRCTPRWPAVRCDVRGQKTYNKVAAIKQGALLALHKNETAERLGIQTSEGRQLFDVLQDYGAYTVDGGGNKGTYLKKEKRNYIRTSISTTQAALAKFQKLYGHPFEFNYGQAKKAQPGTKYYQWIQDVKKIVSNLYVIDDNGPNSIGGKGKVRRRPLAPRLMKKGTIVNKQPTTNVVPRPPELIEVK